MDEGEGRGVSERGGEGRARMAGLLRPTVLLNLIFYLVVNLVVN